MDAENKIETVYIAHRCSLQGVRKYKYYLKGYWSAAMKSLRWDISNRCVSPATYTEGVKFCPYCGGRLPEKPGDVQDSR